MADGCIYTSKENNPLVNFVTLLGSAKRLNLKVLQSFLCSQLSASYTFTHTDTHKHTHVICLNLTVPVLFH